MKNNFLVFSLFVLGSMFFGGCSPVPFQIVVENQSGQELNNVSARSNGKEVRFGVLVDEGVAGHMNAPEMMFGTSNPLEMSLNFTTSDGTQHSKEVSLGTNESGMRKLLLVVDEKLLVKGMWEQLRY